MVGFQQEEEFISGWILSGKRRDDALINELKVFDHLKLSTKVECIHCGDKFRVIDSTVLLPYKGVKLPMVLCKNYPECGGSIIDMIPTKSLKKNTIDFGGFSASFVPMSEKEVEEMKKKAKDLPVLKKGEAPKNGVWYRGF